MVSNAPAVEKLKKSVSTLVCDIRAAGRAAVIDLQDIVIDDLANRGIAACIPSKANRKNPVQHDGTLYRQCHQASSRRMNRRIQFLLTTSRRQVPVTDGGVRLLHSGSLAAMAGRPSGVRRYLRRKLRCTTGKRYKVSEGGLQGQGYCQYTVHVEKLEDSAPGCAKDFAVEYQCLPGETRLMKTLPGEAGLGSRLDLSCP
jgi:hypothetical protein